MSFRLSRSTMSAIALTISLTILTACGQEPPNSQATDVSTETASSADAPEESGSAKQALANHLDEIGATMYGAYWCPHCADQKEMFGTAVDTVNYVECDPEGENAQPQLCTDKGIEGFPTWEINGELYPGVQPLEQLAEISNYEGPQDFD